MKKSNIVLILLGLIIVLFAVVSPSIVVEIHSMEWRIVIGLLGCSSLISGFYKIAHNR